MSQTATTCAPGTLTQLLSMPMPRLPRPMSPIFTTSTGWNGSFAIDDEPCLRIGVTAVAAPEVMVVASATPANAPPMRLRRVNPDATDPRSFVEPTFSRGLVNRRVISLPSERCGYF